jgi:hypothetical protein
LQPSERHRSYIGDHDYVRRNARPEGSVAFTFTVAQPGPVTVTLSSLGTTSPVGAGLGLGTTSGGTACTLTTSISAALPSALPQISVSLPAGMHCVELFDPGNLTSAAAFTILVTHL